MKYVWEEVWRSNSYKRPDQRSARARRRLEEIEKCLCSNLKLGDVVEIGCGDGSFAQQLLESSNIELKTYTGFDLSITALTRAKDVTSLHQTKFGQVDVSKVTLPPNSVDTVFALGILEHLDQPETVLERMQIALRPGGRIVVTTSNTFSLMYVMRRAREALNSWPYGYQRNYTHSEFRELVAPFYVQHTFTTMQGDWDFPVTLIADRTAALFSRNFGRYIFYVGISK
jgi:2-polyprenyl-3-methyl-5-hydroxy-6-metoxy-1,4-benzoquinol methylase